MVAGTFSSPWLAPFLRPGWHLFFARNVRSHLQLLRDFPDDTRRTTQVTMLFLRIWRKYEKRRRQSVFLVALSRTPRHAPKLGHAPALSIVQRYK
jgi:hypothetical protein